MALQINSFIPPGIHPVPQAVNIIDNGNIDALIRQIDNFQGNRYQKILLLFDCLAQAFTLPGRYQGKCLSILINRILQYTINFPQDAANAISTPNVKFNPRLEDLIDKIRVLIDIYHPERGSLRNVRMACFFPIEGHGMDATIPRSINVLETGKIELLINYIDNNLPNMNEKFITLIKCLEQTLSTTATFQGTCESELKERIFEFSQNHPVEALTAIEVAGLNNNSKIKSTIEKIKYLSKPFYKKNWHHFKQTFTNNKSYGVNYLTTGLAFILIYGLQTSIGTSGNTEQDKHKRFVAWTIFSVGLLLLFMPIFASYQLARKKDP